ncbi:histidine kinase [Galbibacter orientalis DSM 19592]|uniref:histidine kinase n=1 Tax=Galbibacter orientalis DSM 19592 TaxID=926559 RepID=I3C195_9FLAO|nr:ATP-binding protein [Galbibacter orientalis]EIJ37388.1 histidine kinase [Galbibacter orientalis DSM 19592]
MQREEQAILIAVFILFFLSIILIVLFVVFQKRKNVLLLDKKESAKRFKQEIAKTQIEIREETFRNISWELHDNIGQLITLAKIQLQTDTNKEDIMEVLNKGLKELRALSKSINPDVLNSITLIAAIKQELERLNKLQYLRATLTVEGKEFNVNNDAQIILFRIIQEFLSNTIKHAKATELNISLKFEGNTLRLFAKDNGKGIPKDRERFDGMGLKNIVKRAQLINAEVLIDSEENKGTQLSILYRNP